RAIDPVAFNAASAANAAAAAAASKGAGEPPGLLEPLEASAVVVASKGIGVIPVPPNAVAFVFADSTLRSRWEENMARCEEVERLAPLTVVQSVTYSSAASVLGVRARELLLITRHIHHAEHEPAVGTADAPVGAAAAAAAAGGGAAAAAPGASPAAPV